MILVQKILIVEDDTSIRELLIEILESEGFKTVHAVNGQEALDLLKNMLELPGLILLDLMMPIKDGRVFRLEQLADKRISQIPVIVMSADNNSNSINANYYLRKPFDLDELLKLVKRIIDLNQ